MKAHIYCITIFLLLLIGCSKESKRIENQITFAKVYGYVKYFHPSDEAAQLDWNSFSIYGATQIGQCKSQSDVIKVLENLFKPIAPTIRFSSDISEFDSNLPVPDSLEGFKSTYWQHFGVSIGMENKGRPYESRRINRSNDESSIQLFNYQPDTNECIIKEIGNGIYCQIPLVLYCNNDYTFPQANHDDLIKLQDELQRIKYSLTQNSYSRLGNVINVYNVFQHFYPYFDVVDVNWEDEFKSALRRCYSDETKSDHLITLQKFTASLKDGHIRVYDKPMTSAYAPPIAWEWVENKLIITRVEEDNDSIKLGDIVTHIDGKTSKQYFEETYSRISAATEGWLNYRANTISLLGDYDSCIELVIDGNEYQLKRTVKPYQWSRQSVNSNKYKEIEKGIWYLNLDIIEMDTITMLLPKLQDCNSIICDLRGRPKGNHGLIQHLLAINDTTSAWMQTPQIVYPDYDRIVGYEKHNWIGAMKTKKPYLGDKNVIFITDGRAISYAESYMGYIEGYNLATIIGQPTAGTNGNINPFGLPGGYKISWTGMKVIKHDGTQQHGVGILPDIYVEKTIQGVKNGRDEFLEKAIELAKNKNAL
ncbi:MULTISPECIES: S41 family peptidase [unclassified Carboxylicivirga]|uniref:S41 family peptidase n=1 Tax=Carboxylicivirga TaxID=1628153 RepID=UPI003D33D9E5